MAVFFVDENFPDHPKAVAAGEPACWLYICGLAYIHRNHTMGAIPKPAAHRLVSKSGPAFAKRLVTVGLWEDKGAAYEVHDYREFNARSIAKREQAKEAAKTRWAKSNAKKDATSNVDAHADASPTADADAHADASPTADADASVSQCPKEPRNQGTKEPVKNIPASASPPLPAEPAEFVEFWQAYPRKTGKPAALKAWKQAGRDPDAVLRGLKRWMDFWTVSKTEITFVPHPATWLNQRRWEDDLPTVQASRAPTGLVQDQYGNWFRP